MLYSGIYSIRNRINGKRYIGSSISIYKRWNTHRRYLRKGIHDNLHLQSSWKKYGEKNFIFEILEDNISEDSLTEKENSYIMFFEIGKRETDYFDHSRGYNTYWAGRTGFVDPKNRKKGKDHCLFGRIPHNKGKTFDELFGIERAKELKDNIKKIQTGKPSPKKYKHKHSWDEMSYNRQYKLWKNNDPIVPLEWLPRRKGVN